MQVGVDAAGVRGKDGVKGQAEVGGGGGRDAVQGTGEELRGGLGRREEREGREGRAGEEHGNRQYGTPPGSGWRPEGCSGKMLIFQRM